ncbi:MAG TPA: DUF1501 domain-containing protein [Pirellula sp.]|nr:DUF1501 domain-containing protein [Pirellula sp.]
MTPRINRRTFNSNSLKGATALAIGAAAPGGWIQSLASTLTEQSTGHDKVLVVIQLTGGNDGLNTIVPYSNELYYKSRPKLAIPKESVLTINPDVGLHPSLRGIASLIEDKNFCVLHGVGYPNPNRSHFESMDIWHSCQRKNSRGSEGWLGRYFSQTRRLGNSDTVGLHLGSEQLPMALVARGVQTPSLASIEQLRWKGKSQSTMSGIEAQSNPPEKSLQDTASSLLDFVSASTSAAMQASERLEKALASPDSSGDFPDSQLGQKLKIISRLLLAGLKTRVYYVTLDGFDTHANQLAAHAGLLRQWSEALHSFHKLLNSAGLGDRVLALTFSEFGRRVAENASQGTDHGAAAPTFLSGPKLENSIVGIQPSLSELDDGDLKFNIDFRSVYATLIEDWLGASSKNVLTEEFSKLSTLGL